MSIFTGFYSVPAVVATSVILVGGYLYSKLYHLRFTKNRHLPQLPSSLFFGHLLQWDKYIKRSATDRHPDYIMNKMVDDLGNPSLMVMDNWPINPSMVVICKHDVAEQITRPSTQFPYSVTRSDSASRVSELIGEHSILRKIGEEWKDIRKRYSPGFAPQYLMTLLPVILEKSKLYLDILDQFCETGESFPLDEHTGNMTFDIIGAVSVGEDMNAQHLDKSKQGIIVTATMEVADSYANDQLQLPWWMIPLTHLKRRRSGNIVREELKKIIRRNFELSQLQPKENPSRSILELSLKDVDTLTPGFLNETADQLKTFIFAGHDATSTLIAWAIYEIYRTPRILKAIRDELKEIFGLDVVKDSAKFCNALIAPPKGDEPMRKMSYISAVIKEILRLYPPAATVRIANPGEGVVVSTAEGEYNLDGNWIYINHTRIHRDRSVFGDTADDFVPERWLKGGSSEGLAPSTWRPFERGPRNCIGQELANIEARAIIALIVLRYDFEKVGLGELDLDKNGKPVLNDQRQYKTKSDMYMTARVVGKPVDRMMMKVHRAL